MKKGIALILLIVLCIVSFTACNVETKQYFVYGTILEVTIKGAGANSTAEDIYDAIDNLEGVFSPTVTGSDLFRINNATVGEKVVVSDKTNDLIKTALYVYDVSGGAYDPSVYPLVRLWEFSGDKFVEGISKRPPSDEDITSTLAFVGLDKAFSFDTENKTVTKLIDGAMLDFGGLAKGYTVDLTLDLVSSKQKGLINLGGNIGAINKDYAIGIGNPRESNTAYFGAFTLKSGECISTSGDYERYYFYEGVRYHHIINPWSGRPSLSGLVSVSVITDDGALGDALSTAVMILGKEKGVELLNGLGVKGVLVEGDLSFTVIGDLDFVKK